MTASCAVETTASGPVSRRSSPLRFRVAAARPRVKKKATFAGPRCCRRQVLAYTGRGSDELLERLLIAPDLPLDCPRACARGIAPAPQPLSPRAPKASSPEWPRAALPSYEVRIFRPEPLPRPLSTGGRRISGATLSRQRSVDRLRPLGFRTATDSAPEEPGMRMLRPGSEVRARALAEGWSVESEASSTAPRPLQMASPRRRLFELRGEASSRQTASCGAASPPPPRRRFSLPGRRQLRALPGNGRSWASRRLGRLRDHLRFNHPGRS